MNAKWVTGMRWTARIIGALVIALFLLIFIGEAVSASGPVSGLLGLPLAEYLEGLGVLVMMVGAVLAWWREALGGVLCIAGGAFFNIVLSLQNGEVRLMWFPLVFVGIGLIFLLCSQAETTNRVRPA